MHHASLLVDSLQIVLDRRLTSRLNLMVDLLTTHLQWSIAISMGTAVLLNSLIPIASHSLPLLIILRISIGVAEAAYFPAATLSTHPLLPYGSSLLIVFYLFLSA